MINLVFDIDEVFACSDVRSENQAKFFLKKGAILTAIKTHYIFPGVIELIQLLFQTENVRVSFFSSATKERNELFVNELLVRALGAERYEKIKESIKVLSKEHLIKSKEEEVQIQYKKYGLYNGNCKKDISKALREEDKLEDAVLIEDDYTYIAFGQVKNVLIARRTNGRSFAKLKSKEEAYDSEGFKKLPVCFCLVEDDNESVLNGRTIDLIREKGKYRLQFLNNETEKYEERIISEERNSDLIEELNKLCESEKRWFQIMDELLLEKIYQLVVEFGGKKFKIARSVNRIYYIAGMIFHAMEAAKEESVSISDVLFRLQYKQKSDDEPEAYEPRFKEQASVESIYQLGLEKLREVNPELSFIGPHNYVQILKEDITAEEKEFLSGVLDNQGQECCIQ